MKKLLACALACLIFSFNISPAWSQAFTATRVHDAPRIDGVLEDSIWRHVSPITSFTQREPVEGAPATERTEVHILFGQDAVYVGAHLFDSAPDSIVARLGRRDAQLTSDEFYVFLDPHHDRRTGYYFGLSAAGTRYDGVLRNDEWRDDSWDGVWQGRVKRTASGWTAELRIPYSQLRFTGREEATWGVNFQRNIARKSEEDYYVMVPEAETGFVSKFAPVSGLAGVNPPRQLEIVPYATAKAAYTDPEAGDPFNDGSAYTPDLGADLEVGLTRTLTLDATINPDFGQVEVDPAVINLSDTETYFPEKRPFFIKGNSTFDFGRGGVNSSWGFNWGSPSFFYSRRIGRVPQGALPAGYDYALRPDNTTILGAAKLTGKAPTVGDIGVLQSVTAREMATVQQDDRRFKAEVEPLSYYNVLRARRDWNEGHQAIGVMSTTTLRHFNDDRLRDVISGQAYAFGVDGWTHLGAEHTWALAGWTGLSHVRGTEERLTQLQRSSIHYFQRPDADHVEVDSTATSLTGFSGRLKLNKQRGNVVFNSAVGVISPSFHVTDLGFQWGSDVVNAHLGGGYRWTDPGRLARRKQILATVFGNVDFGGNVTDLGLWSLAAAELLNYYTVEVNGGVNPWTVNNRRTRGGPLTLDPPRGFVGMSGRSDRRSDWVVGLNIAVGAEIKGGRQQEAGVEVEWKPAPNVSLSLAPSFTHRIEPVQWVGAFTDPMAVVTFGRRYVFGRLNQYTLSSSVRLNWTFTPNLSLQLYMQPLLSSGDYRAFKELARPGSYDFEPYSERQITYRPDEDRYEVAPDDAGPAAPFSFSNPNFRAQSLRGNAVLRWEYRPGSTLFLVWTQTRSRSEALGTFDVAPMTTRLFNTRPDNVFMVKLTYWLSR